MKCKVFVQTMLLGLIDCAIALLAELHRRLGQREVSIRIRWRILNEECSRTLCIPHKIYVLFRKDGKEIKKYIQDQLVEATLVKPIDEVYELFRGDGEMVSCYVQDRLVEAVKEMTFERYPKDRTELDLQRSITHVNPDPKTEPPLRGRS